MSIEDVGEGRGLGFERLADLVESFTEWGGRAWTWIDSNARSLPGAVASNFKKFWAMAQPQLTRVWNAAKPIIEKSPRISAAVLAIGGAGAIITSGNQSNMVARNGSRLAGVALIALAATILLSPATVGV